MLEIASRSRIERELTNRIGQSIELFKCDWSIQLRDNSRSRIPALWTQDFIISSNVHMFILQWEQAI